jgi:hypothetical protein
MGTHSPIIRAHTRLERRIVQFQMTGKCSVRKCCLDIELIGKLDIRQRKEVIDKCASCKQVHSPAMQFSRAGSRERKERAFLASSSTTTTVLETSS